MGVEDLSRNLYTTAIIGGTGLGSFSPEYTVTERTIETRFGRAVVYDVRELKLLFVPRHGRDHTVPPHEINFRAIIAAISDLGVNRILATNAVGSLRLDLEPDSLVLIDDFLDFTRSRDVSLFDVSSGVRHTDFSVPYCPQLRSLLLSAAAAVDIDLLPRGTYACTDGPRFESPAEVRMYGQLGGDVVGMTGLPEAVFAREARICYAAVAIVTNFAAGLTAASVDHADVIDRMGRNIDRVRRLFAAALPAMRAQQTCGCATSVSVHA